MYWHVYLNLLSAILWGTILIYMLSESFSDSRLLFKLEPEERGILPILSNLVDSIPDSTIRKFNYFLLKTEEGKWILEPLWSSKESSGYFEAKLRTFWVQFFRDPFSEEVFRESHRVGAVHAEKGVNPPLFLSALFHFGSLLREHVEKQIEDRALQEGIIQLMFKLLFYLGSVALVAYFERLGQDLEEAYAEISRLNRIYLLLREINLLLFEERVSLERFFKMACDILVREGGFTLAWIGLIESRTKEIKPVAAAGSTEYLGDFCVTLDPARSEGRGPCGEALRTGKPVIVQDAEEDPNFMPWREKALEHGLRSVVALPLVLENEVKGGLFLYHSKPQHFVLKEVQLLQEIARDLSVGWTHIEKSRELERILYTDELTGLKNERYFIDVLGHELEVAKKQKQRLAIIRLDLDEFTLLNHSLGRVAGDEVLKEVGNRLVRLVGNRGTVVRSGADEFSLSYLFETDSEIVDLVERINTALSRPIDVAENTTRVSASVGLAFFPEDASSTEELFEAASIALNKAKKKDPAGVAFYSEKEAREIRSRWRLAEELKRAYEENEFVLFFQPRVNLFTRKISSFEALLRWKHPQKGIIPPGKFIPVLEDTGLIIEVGRWVIKESARFLEKLLSKDPEINMSFNVSIKQFQDEEFLRILEETLREVSLPPERLEVEITESSFFEASAQAAEILRQINRLGLKIAIDDFGTGYSSFAYLKRIPAEILKIDYSFVKGIPENREDASVVMAIVAMARNLGKTLVAEGVERREQLAFLMGLGVDEVQGYYFTPPLPGDETLRFLEAFNPERFFK